MSKSLAAVICASVLCLCSAHARADLVTYNFASYVGDPSVTGTITLNTADGVPGTGYAYSGAPAIPTTLYGSANGGVEAVTLSIAGRTFNLSDAGATASFVVYSQSFTNPAAFDFTDFYQIGNETYDFRVLSQVGPTRNFQIPTIVEAYNYQDQIPYSQPYTYTFYAGNGTLTEGTTTVTPEPSSFLLLGTGLFGAAGATWRRVRAR